jgi:hypothetical protein
MSTPTGAKWGTRRVIPGRKRRQPLQGKGIRRKDEAAKRRLLWTP